VTGCGASRRGGPDWRAVTALTWGAFAELEPELATAGRALLYQFGVGLGFLATTRVDGGPRLHPICPLLTSDGAYAFIVPSLKQGDLRRDGRYALHSFPCPDDEDAFCAMGTARLVDDRATRAALGEQFVAERSELPVTPPEARDDLFELRLERAFLTQSSGHGDPDPVHTVWRAGRARSAAGDASA
jgi:hypothetical protein